MSTKIRSRKLWIFLSLQALATLFFLGGSLDGAQWVEFTKWNTMIYVGGNVGEHFSGGKI